MMRFIVASLVLVLCSTSGSALARDCFSDQKPKGIKYNFSIPHEDFQTQQVKLQLINDGNKKSHATTICVCQEDATALRFDLELVDASGGVSNQTLMVPMGSCAVQNSAFSLTVRVNQGGRGKQVGTAYWR